MKNNFIKQFLIFLLMSPVIFGGGVAHAVSDGEGNEVFPDVNVGIGTALPSSLLEVGAKRFNVTVAGNVGIGSSIPGAKLDVVAGALRVMNDPATASVNQGGQAGSLYVQNNIEIDGKIYGDGSALTGVSAISGLIDNYIVRANGTSAIEISNIYDSGANIGIGTVSPVSTLEIAPAGTLAVPQGAAAAVSKAGQIAVDTTDDQFTYYGSAKRVLPYERTACVTVENLVAADDDFAFMSLPDNVTLVRGWCHCQGTCTTKATITLETVQIGTAGPTVDAVGGGAINCADMVTGATPTTLAADNTVDALDVVRFNVTNIPAPTSDKYTLCVAYTFDAQ